MSKILLLGKIHLDTAYIDKYRTILIYEYEVIDSNWNSILYAVVYYYIDVYYIRCPLIEALNKISHN